MAEDKKVSEVISELDSKVTSILGRVKNLDSTNKIILSKVNALVGTIESLATRSPVIAPSQLKPTGKVPSVSLPNPNEKAPPVVRQQQQVMVAQPIDEPVHEDDLSEAVMPPQANRRGSRVKQAINTSKVQVQQNVAFNDGRVVAFANVEILNLSGIVEKSTRTNTKGNWLAALNPGEYTVHLSKRMSVDNTKPPVQLQYKIQIPESVEPLQLPRPEFPES